MNYLDSSGKLVLIFCVKKVVIVVLEILVYVVDNVSGVYCEMFYVTLVICFVAS